jgi:hypothetical protein
VQVRLRPVVRELGESTTPALRTERRERAADQ